MPILHASLETDLRLAAQLEQALLVTLTDEATIRNVPGAIDFRGSVSGTGSDTHRLRYVSLNGSDHFAATAAEDTAVAETALTDTSVDIAVTRSALRRDIGDLAVATGFAQDIDPQRLAGDMVASYNGFFNDTYGTTIATAATDVGTSGAAMTVDDYHDAVTQLELSSVPGPYLAVLHPKQFTDFQTSLRSEGGAAMFSPATFEMLSIRGQGFAGSYLGVGIFNMTDVITTGPDHEGAMLGAGALAYKVALIDQRSMLGTTAALAVRVDEIMVEVLRDPITATVQIVGNAWMGMALTEQARIVGIVTAT